MTTPDTAGAQLSVPRVKAIETQYKGYRFRSRLEARWAVFFDALGLKWEYEPEGFELGAGVRYLPDFRVTSPQGIVQWYEIKPVGTTSDPKVDAFAASLRSAYEAESGDDGATEITLLAGDPVEWLQSCGPDGGVCPRCGGLQHCFGYIDRDADEVWLACYPCDVTTPGGGGHSPEPGVLAAARPHKGNLVLPRAVFEATEARVRNAAVKARGMQFKSTDTKAFA